MHVNMIDMKVSIDIMLMDFIKEFDRLIIKLVHIFATDLLCWYFFIPLAFWGEDKTGNRLTRTDGWDTCWWCKYVRLLHIYTVYTLNCISSDLQISINPCHVHSDGMYVKTISLNVCRIKYAKLEDVFLCLWLPNTKTGKDINTLFKKFKTVKIKTNWRQQLLITGLILWEG